MCLCTTLELIEENAKTVKHSLKVAQSSYIWYANNQDYNALFGEYSVESGIIQKVRQPEMKV